MAAITWRNVVGPSLADAARPLELARQGFNDSFTQLGNLITQRQEQQAVAAKEGYLDMLSSAATPEQLTEMQRTGQVQQALAALDPRVRAQVRGQDDARLKTLRDAATSGFTYDDSVEARAVRDQQAAAEAAILSGDPAAADAITALPTRFQAPLLTKQDARSEQLKERDRGDTRFEREGVTFDQKGVLHEVDVLAKRAQAAKTEAETGMMPLKEQLLRAQANAANASATYSRGRLGAESAAAAAAKTVADTTGADAIRTKAMDEFIKKSPYSNGSFDSNQGQEAVLKAMKDMKFTPGQIEDTMYNLNKQFGGGAELQDIKGKSKVPLPVDVVIRAINQSSDNPLTLGWSRRGDDVRNILGKLLEDPNTTRQILTAQQVLQNREVPELLAPRPNPLDMTVGKKKSEVTAVQGVPTAVAPPVANATPKVGSSPAQIGAFEVPPQAKVASSESVSFAPGGTAFSVKATDKPVEIPKDVQWRKPETLVAANPDVAKRSTGEKAVVTYVADGDTASLTRKDGSAMNCRIDKIDAPETAHPQVNKPAQEFGEESKRTLRNMIENKEVTVRITRPTQDKYGRNLCQIEVEGKDVSAEMLKKGAAWLYKEYADDPALKADQATAKKNRVGLWADPIPEYPRDFRRRNPGDK